MLDNKLNFSSFRVFQYESDFLYNEFLLRRGAQILPLKPLPEKKFEMKFSTEEIAMEILNDLFKKQPELKTQDLIIGFEHFKTDLFTGFRYREQIAKAVKGNWKIFAKRCQWEYVVLVKCDSQVFIVSEEIETRFRFPEKQDEQDLFQMIIFPNEARHFVHLGEFESRDELEACTPKKEVYRRVENYFLNHFYNCPVLTTVKVPNEKD